MKTAPVRKLFAYWNERRGSRLAPERGDIEPGAIHDILGDSFIITFDRPADHPFRLAGTRVCVLFGHEVKGEPFVQLWDEASRERIQELVALIANEGSAVVAGAVARTAEGSRADIELLLLPLYHRGNMQVRLLGAMTPIAHPYWLGAERVASLTLGAIRHLGTASANTTGPSFAVARARHGLRVYDGGLS